MWLNFWLQNNKKKGNTYLHLHQISHNNLTIIMNSAILGVKIHLTICHNNCVTYVPLRVWIMSQFREFLSPQNQSHKNPEIVSRGKNFARFQIIQAVYVLTAGHQRVTQFGLGFNRNCSGIDHWWIFESVQILSPCHLLVDSAKSKN